MSDNSALVARVREARRRLTENGPAHERSDGDFGVVSLPAADCDVLRDLIAEARPTTVIEIGLAYGNSALAIAEGLVQAAQAGTRHIIIDAYQNLFGNAGWEAITGAGLGDVCSLIQERSQTALPRLLADGFTADVAFVDGGHRFHDVFVDLYFLRGIVRPGGLIILDDCQWPSVATAVRYFELNTGWTPQAIDAETRLRAYRLPDPPVEPAFTAFKPFS